MLHNRSSGRVRGILAAMVLGAAQAATAQPAVEQTQQANCDCESIYREYKVADTPQTEALFDAVNRTDEAAFSAALAQVDQPGSYAQHGVPLLHAMLMPPRNLRSKDVYWSMAPQEAARIREAHQANLPARTRMLAALLAKKPALDDVTYDSRRPPLHLALLYGTPEIMDMLLAAGAKPDQRGDENRKPLEFLLNRDFEFAVRMTYRPRLVDHKSLSRMVVALFKAGATRPYSDFDQSAGKSANPPFVDDQGHARPAADFLAWAPLVELTEGAEPLQALAATGSKPAYGEELTPLALAGYLGNAGAVPVLMSLGPRKYGEKGERDAWLDAAQGAVMGGHPEIASQLLRADMPFAQAGPQSNSSALIFAKMESSARPIMNLAAQRGDAATIQRLLALGASPEGDTRERHGNTPLADAVLAGKREAVKALLAAGANPAAVRDGYDLHSALDVAVIEGNAPVLRDLLAAMKPQARQALWRDQDHSPVQRLLHQRGKQGAEMLRLFADAGFDVKSLGADAIRQALENHDESMAAALIEAGVAVNLAPPPAAKADGEANPRYDRHGEPPLLWAVALRQTAIVELLLAKGADPAAMTPEGESAMYWVLAKRDGAMLDRLLQAGAKLDDARLPKAPAPYALLNAAVASGDMALVRRVSQANGQPLADACLPEDAEFILLDKAGYFEQLAAAGFTGRQELCAREAGALPQRIVSLLLRGRQLVVARRDTVVQVLRQLKASGTNLDALLSNGDTPLNTAIEHGRKDVADALLSAGASPDTADAAGRSPAWVALETGQPGMLALLSQYHARFDTAGAPAGQSFQATLACQSAPEFRQVLQTAGVTLQAACPQVAQGKRSGSKAPSKSAAAVELPGHYFLRGVREVGSELLLSENGNFDYLMTYGGVDIMARGTWRSDGKQVFLDTPPIQPYSAIEDVRADTRPAENGQLTVRVYYQDRPVKVDVAMSSADADYAGIPRQSEGAEGVSAPIAPGALKALSIFVPLAAGARWHEVDISKIDPAARAIRIDVTAPEAAASSPLHKVLVVQKDGALVEMSGGRELQYEKE